MKLFCLLAIQAPKWKQLVMFLLLHLVSYLFISVTERRDSFIKPSGPRGRADRMNSLVFTLQGLVCQWQDH